MKKRIIAVLGILAVLSSILLVGCSESGSKTKKETIGIIGAISDKPDGGGSVDFNEFQEKAAARCAAVVQYMVERL